MIVDLMDATVTAVFARLNSTIALTSLCTVTQHVEQDAQGTITRIGKVEGMPIGGKGEQVEEILLDVETIYRGSSPAQVRAVMIEQRRALEEQPLGHDGVVFSGGPQWAGGALDGPAQDGVTYVGAQTFRIIAEPA